MKLCSSDNQIITALHLSTQAQDILFEKKKYKKISHPPLHFNNNIVSETSCQKHLGIFLDARLKFEEHFKIISAKVNKTIRLLWKLQKTLPRLILITMYKAFVRPYLD